MWHDKNLRAGRKPCHGTTLIIPRGRLRCQRQLKLPARDLPHKNDDKRQKSAILNKTSGVARRTAWGKQWQLPSIFITAARAGTRGNLPGKWFRDSWKDQHVLDKHHASPLLAKIAALRDKYDLHMSVERYVSDGTGIPATDKAYIRT